MVVMMARAGDGEPALNRHWVDVSCLLGIKCGRQATWPLILVHLVIHTMLFHCWTTIFDAGPTLKQHWVNDSRMLGISYQLLTAARGETSPVFVYNKGEASGLCCIQYNKQIIGAFQ